MLEKRRDVFSLTLQTAVENQQRLAVLEAKVKQLESYFKLTIRILLGLLIVLSHIAK
jgi:hypothetical protein